MYVHFKLLRRVQQCVDLAFKEKTNLRFSVTSAHNACLLVGMEKPSAREPGICDLGVFLNLHIRAREFELPGKMFQPLKKMFLPDRRRVWP